jgi:hypothetical protein
MESAPSLVYTAWNHVAQTSVLTSLRFIISTPSAVRAHDGQAVFGRAHHHSASSGFGLYSHGSFAPDLFRTHGVSSMPKMVWISTVSCSRSGVAACSAFASLEVRSIHFVMLARSERGAHSDSSEAHRSP